MSALIEAHDRVEARVAELMGTINAATAELVRVIGDVVEQETWGTAAGIRSPEHWVTWQCGVSHATAEAWVTMARRRSELPKSMELFDEGRITSDVMAAIGRRCPSERDVEVANQAQRMLHSQVDRLLRGVAKADDTLVEPERDRVTFGATDNGRWRLHANLSLDDGAIVEKALAAARSQVFHERHPDAAHELFSDVTWADGLVRAAELALRQSAVVGGREHRPGERFQVWLHYDADSLRANVHMGGPLPDALRHYLLCDADIRAMIESDGVLREMSSKLRTVDDRIRAFIEQRDGGCRVPGCPMYRWLHIHHLVHWENGGRTESSNLCALCPRHHRLHHLGLLEIRGSPVTPDGLRFFDRNGREIVAPARAAVKVPAPPPERPYVHPTGERVDWRWFDWKQLDAASLN